MDSIQSLKIAVYIRRVTKDARLSTSHLSLYMAMLSCWQSQNFPYQFKIIRREIMSLSKIAAISTYHRCMREMIGYGYFKYEPEFDSYKGSKIMLI
jgi:hypothetical protein